MTESPQFALLRVARGNVHRPDKLVEVEEVVAVAVENAHDVAGKRLGVALKL